MPTLKTFTTGQASAKLGMLVTAKFIQEMGLTPAGSVKGNPIWNIEHWPKLLASIIRHLDENVEEPVPGEAAPPKAPAKEKKDTAPEQFKKSKAATSSSKPFVDDEDDEL